MIVSCIIESFGLIRVGATVFNFCNMSFIIGALENGLHINSSNLSISYSCYIPRSIVSLTKSHSMAALG